MKCIHGFLKDHCSVCIATERDEWMKKAFKLEQENADLRKSLYNAEKKVADLLERCR